VQPLAAGMLASRARLVLEGQGHHLLWLLLLLAALYGASHLPRFREGELLGLTTPAWVTLAVANAVAHQVYVLLCWRAELHLGLLSRWLGNAAFGCYAALFVLLLLARPVLVTAVSLSNRDTLDHLEALASTTGVLVLLPCVYLLYSVHRHFGFRRAFGIDHFEASYRDEPLVREGIFRLTPNAMYVFGFLALWSPALYFRSVAALCAAAFSHLFIWVHYLCTERPDMRHIYAAGAQR